MELAATEITAGYGGAAVLNGISAAVRQGELVGLIGPNGCGKSTLLRCLSRILRPSSGSVQLDGRAITAWAPREAARRLAFVPQQEPAMFEFTVRDLVIMGRHPHIDPWKGETERDYAVAAQAMADADVAYLADRPVTQLSGGEHRRVLLARALAQQTPLLLLDEPTAHLDVTHQTDILTLVRSQTRVKGQGVLAALHDLNQAAEFCDRLILMRAGRIIFAGDPSDVLTIANLRQAYDADGEIGANPITGRPMVLAIRSARAAEVPAAETAGTPCRVHLICGGGAGSKIMRDLVSAGFVVTAGMLDALDADAVTATALGVEVAAEAPFSPFSDPIRSRCEAMMRDADVVLIAPIPFGLHNFDNLEIAVRVQKPPRSLVILGDEVFSVRDFTGGRAAEILGRLLELGAVRRSTLEEWIAETRADA